MELLRLDEMLKNEFNITVPLKHDEFAEKFRSGKIIKDEDCMDHKWKDVQDLYPNEPTIQQIIFAKIFESYLIKWEDDIEFLYLIDIWMVECYVFKIRLGNEYIVRAYSRIPNIDDALESFQFHRKFKEELRNENIEMLLNGN